MVEFISLGYFAVYNSVNFSLDYHSWKINLQEPGPLENVPWAGFLQNQMWVSASSMKWLCNPFSISFTRQLCQSNEMACLKSSSGKTEYYVKIMFLKHYPIIICSMHNTYWRDVETENWGWCDPCPLRVFPVDKRNHWGHIYLSRT